MNKLQLLGNRLTHTLIVGAALTVLSTAVVGVNLSRNDYLPSNDAVNQYFDTCVGSAFGSGTPQITVDARGFPLSHLTTANIPVCDNRVAIKLVGQTAFDAGNALGNLLFWSVLSFWVLGKINRLRGDKTSSKLPVRDTTINKGLAEDSDIATDTELANGSTTHQNPKKINSSDQTAKHQNTGKL